MKSLKKKPIQIYIEPQQDHVLEALSKRKGISKAGIIRESLKRFLREVPVEEDPAMGLIGLGNSGKRDLSDQHDKYIYKYARSKKKGWSLKIYLLTPVPGLLWWTKMIHTTKRLPQVTLRS